MRTRLHLYHEQSLCIGAMKTVAIVSFNSVGFLLKLVLPLCGFLFRLQREPESSETLKRKSQPLWLALHYVVILCLRSSILVSYAYSTRLHAQRLGTLRLSCFCGNGLLKHTRKGDEILAFASTVKTLAPRWRRRVFRTPWPSQRV